jgi:hypothetical protein
MYSKRPSLVIGFHGCDLSVRDEVVMDQLVMKKSENDYDWLGHGIYFWENNEERALKFANEQATRNKVDEPAVLGAFIDLGNCLDLLNSKYLQLLKTVGYPMCEYNFQTTGMTMPENEPVRKSGDLILRRLDCAVIESLHMFYEEKGLQPFDSVRGVFWEGNDLYPGAGMKEKNHIQICIRNIDCVKGFFIPRKLSA